MRDAQCPPTMQNAHTSVSEGNIHTLSCNEGYWYVDKSTNQIVDCISTSWKASLQPCIGKLYCNVFIVKLSFHLVAAHRTLYSLYVLNNNFCLLYWNAVSNCFRHQC